MDHARAHDRRNSETRATFLSDFGTRICQVSCDVCRYIRKSGDVRDKCMGFGLSGAATHEPLRVSPTGGLGSGLRSPCSGTEYVVDPRTDLQRVRALRKIG